MPLNEQVRPASFRNVPFTPVSVDADGFARRSEAHQFPFRDRGFVEDFGRQTPTFAFECFVPWAQRAALIEACRTEGPGALVHPFFGELQVVCTSCQPRDSTQHWGLTYFTLTFVEAGENRYPDVVPDTGRRTSAAAEEGRPRVRQAFVARFPTSVAQWVTDASIARMGSLSSALAAARALVPGALNLETFNGLLGELSDGAALVADPTLLAETVSATIQSMAGLSTDPLSTIRMLEAFLSDFGSTFPVITATPGTSRAAELQRQNALLRLGRSSAVIEASVAATEVPLASYNDAAALRLRMVELFDGEMEAAGDSGDDETLGALDAVRTEILSDLRERGGALAKVRTLTLPSTTPAVVLAHRLYGDASRGEEIVARNRIRHPMFLPAAVPLEVLSG